MSSKNAPSVAQSGGARFQLHAWVGILALCVGLLCGCAPKVTPSEAYTKMFAARLSESDPKIQVAIKGDLELAITYQDGTKSTAYLDNGFKLYRDASSDEDREAVLNTYLRGFVSSTSSRPIDTSLIVPIIKDAGWISEISAVVAGKGNKPPELLFDALNNDLVILYAEDSPDKLAYLTPERLAEAKIGRDGLRTLATQNLRRLLKERIKIEPTSGGYMVTVGGTFEASVLLLEEFWRGDVMPVNGDYVITVPTRDLLLVTGSKNPPGIEALRRVAGTVSSDTPYRITSALFVFRDGKLTRLEP